MAQNRINWTTRIKVIVDVTYDTHVPPDISFKIEENGSMYIIDAHKAVMGWVSKVFNGMFFVADTGNEELKELLIKRTTREAFQIMKDAIYRTKDIEESLKGKSIQQVFTVLDLVSRYEIPELVVSVMDLINNFLHTVQSVHLAGKSLWEVFLVLNISVRDNIWGLFVSVYEHLDNFPLTEENVMDVAEDAMWYAGSFKDEVRVLLNTCVNFLKSRLIDSQFAAEDEDRNDIVIHLHGLMKDVDSGRNNYFQQKRRFDEMREKDYSRRFSKATISHIDWTSRIQKAFKTALNTHIPPDITFKIEEDGSTFEIKAHKVVIGWASIVFNKMFFVADTRDKDAKEILVKGTTKQAFQIMKEFIYNIRPIQKILKGKAVHEVFAVLNIARRYEIPELELSVKKHLTKFPLNKENVLDVAENAIHYGETFDFDSQGILEACARFLKPNFTDAQSVFDYVADNEDYAEGLVKLMPLMKTPCPSLKQITLKQIPFNRCGCKWRKKGGGKDSFMVEKVGLCYRCDKPGHFADECPLNGGGGRCDCHRDSYCKERCDKCKRPGHCACDCRDGEDDRVREKSETRCRKCNKLGHFARDCPDGDPCLKCKRSGHMGRNCSQKEDANAAIDSSDTQGRQSPRHYRSPYATLHSAWVLRR